MEPDYRPGDAPTEGPDGGVAIIGMACRFAGATTPEQYWSNLREGVESVEHFSEDALVAAGVDPALIAQPGYVRAGAPLADMEWFDAAHFGLSPRDAAIMDPQHRHFLECAWEALEDAGHVPAAFPGAIGVFGGSGHNAYMPCNLLTNPGLVRDVGLFLLRHTGNDKDFLTTRISYLLDLKGPSVNVQTACSTSLVAVHMAAQSLLAGECDMALAGGASIELPHRQGYVHEEGGIMSPDGHCRPFDAASQGTVFGSGVGVVVLRRLTDAIADRDHIYAVIRGSAVNNDGATKVGYLAPSVDGQAQAIAEALAVAGVDAGTIGYVEAHGTGTPIGDPIEVAALTQAFRRDTDRTGYCGIGSVKANIGHTDTAAGTAGLIKVALALHHRELPPTINFTAPNPACELADSPFAVTHRLTPWIGSDGVPRRAGVSSLGVGGTNAHVVVEEAPARISTPARRSRQLLAIAARTATALDANTAALARHLTCHADIDLADAAYTLTVGRHARGRRRIVVAGSATDAAAALAIPDRCVTGDAIADRKVAFLFCGAGSQHATMGYGLYQTEPVYRDAIDTCIAATRAIHGLDLRRWLFPSAADAEQAAREILRPSVALPALFATQLALARLWMSWGVAPAGMIGHSSGEYAAAHLAGVIDLEDAIRIVGTRGQLFERLPPGAMLSVPLPEEELRALLPPELSIAAINGASLCIVSGPVAAIELLHEAMETREIACQRVRIDVAAHSAMLAPILDDFRACLARVRFAPPQRRFVSNLTGGWITAAEATDPEYWVRHLRETVRFIDGLERLLEDKDQVLLEVGPGRTMASLARQHPGRARTQPVINAMRHAEEAADDAVHALTALGRLWTLGVAIDWAAFWGGELRQRVPLPTYRFDRERHWIEPGQRSLAAATSDAAATTEDGAVERQSDMADWFSTPVWRLSPLAPPAPGTAAPVAAPDVAAANAAGACALVFEDGQGIGTALAAHLRKQGRVVVSVQPGRRFARLGKDRFALVADDPAGYRRLIEMLTQNGFRPVDVYHCWLVTARTGRGDRPDRVAAVQAMGFDSVLALVQALAESESDGVSIVVATTGVQRVSEEADLSPAKATVLGVVRTAAAEYPGLRIRSVDLTLPATATAMKRLAAALVAEAAAEAGPPTLAYRAGERWVQDFAPTRRAALDVAHPQGQAQALARIRAGGTYCITGGLGGLGLALARHLAESYGARLALIARTRLPERVVWGETLAAGASDDPLCRILRQLIAIEAVGGTVMIVTADVSDRRAVKQAIAAIRVRFGRIDGVFHAAGVLDDGVMQSKTPAAAAAVIRPKLHGTLALAAALVDEPPDFMMLYSSISAFAGLAGQVDYAAANAFLDAYAQSRHGDDRTRVVSVAWSQWREVGMAAALGAGVATAPPAPVGPGRTLGHPFLDTAYTLSADELLVESRLSAETHWLLDEHRLGDGSSLIPGTGYIEIVRASFADIAPGAIAIEEATFLSPFVVAAGTARDLCVHLRRDDSPTRDGARWRFRIFGRETGDAAAHWIEHAQGFVAAAAGLDAIVDKIPAPIRAAGPPVATPDMIRTRCRTIMLNPDGPAQSPHLRFGPRWHAISEVRIGDAEALLTLRLPDAYRADFAEIALHPALLDMASAGAQALIPGYDPATDFFAPLRWGRLHLVAPLPAVVLSHVRYRPDPFGSTIATFDVTLMDEAGAVLAEIDGFSMIRVRNSALLAAPRGGAAARGAQAGAAMDALTLSPQDGVQAVERILLGEPAAHIVVSPAALYPALARLRAPRRGTRPVAQSDAVDGPRTETESIIAELWCDMLGVERVGRHDDFFDLGGHSLLAVQFTNRLRKRLGKTLPLAALLQGPTVERLAAAIDPEGAASVAAGESPPMATDADAGPAKLAATALVAPTDLILIRSGANHAPLFLVHDGLGQTLLYRSLAYRLAPGHAVYGIEPLRRCDGMFAHSSIVAMAAEYVARVTAVHPGPYLLAGLCAGGVIAFEMARQLQDAGLTVAMIAILDAADVEAAPRRLYTTRARLKRVRDVMYGGEVGTVVALGRALPVIVRKAANAARWEIASRIERRRRRELLSRLRADAEAPASGSGPQRAASLSFLQVYELAHRAHRPHGLFAGGDVVLFKATQSCGDDDDEPFGERYADRILGWGKRVADDVVLEIIPGGHVSLLREPHVAVVAARLQTAIDTALARPDPAGLIDVLPDGGADAGADGGGDAGGDVQVRAVVVGS